MNDLQNNLKIPYGIEGSSTLRGGESNDGEGDTLA